MDANHTSQFPSSTDVLFDDDPRALFARALATGDAVVAGVRSDQLADPSPCAGFDVAQLLGHLVSVVQHVAVIGWGAEELGHPVAVEDVPADGWAEAWRDASEQFRTTWRDDAALTRTVRLPWAEMSGAATLLAYTMEVTVHTWDLATATGQPVEWDPDVLDVALEAARRHLPAVPRGGFVPFDEVVPVPVGAPPIERLVAWTGRRP